MPDSGALSAPTIFEVQVAANSNDAEERGSGTSSDLELVLDRELQTMGIRFNGVAVPRRAHISSAHIQFKADETHSEPTTLQIRGQDVSNALTFVNVANNITDRILTDAFVDWDPPAWVNRGDAGPAQQTPDIAAVIQEIVSRGDWSQGLSLVMIITSADPDKRVAESFNGDQVGAPLLHVEYFNNNPPLANNNTAQTGLTFQ